MDGFFRTRLVTTTSEQFINPNGGTSMDKFYVFHNLGPAKVTILFAGSSGPGWAAPLDLRPGDFSEVFCAQAKVQLATGDSYDGAILQWVPAS